MILRGKPNAGPSRGVASPSLNKARQRKLLSSLKKRPGREVCTFGAKKEKWLQTMGCFPVKYKPEAELEAHKEAAEADLKALNKQWAPLKLWARNEGHTAWQSLKKACTHLHHELAEGLCMMVKPIRSNGV